MDASNSMTKREDTKIRLVSWYKIRKKEKEDKISYNKIGFKMTLLDLELNKYYWCIRVINYIAIYSLTISIIRLL